VVGFGSFMVIEAHGSVEAGLVGGLKSAGAA
jgi:hypothetical protein